MSIRAERKATGRRPEVGNGEQRPRCDGGQRQFIAGGGMSYSKLRVSERNGKLVF